MAKTKVDVTVAGQKYEVDVVLDGVVDVRMLVFDAPYQPGEVVKVNARRAERWVKEGIAEYAR